MTDKYKMMNEIDEINLMIKVLPKRWPTRTSKNTPMINEVIERTEQLKATYEAEQYTIEGMMLQLLISNVEDKIWDRNYRS